MDITPVLGTPACQTQVSSGLYLDCDVEIPLLFGHSMGQKAWGVNLGVLLFPAHRWSTQESLLQSPLGLSVWAEFLGTSRHKCVVWGLESLLERMTQAWLHPYLLNPQAPSTLCRMEGLTSERNETMKRAG